MKDLLAYFHEAKRSRGGVGKGGGVVLHLGKLYNFQLTIVT